MANAFEQASPKLWLSFKHKTGVMGQLLALHEWLGDFNEADTRDLTLLGRKLRRRLDCAHPNFFLVLDNLHSSNLLKGFLMEGPLTTGYLLITGRYPLDSVSVTFTLDPLNKAACVGALAEELTYESAECVYEVCEGRPLKIGQLFHFLDEHNKDLAEFTRSPPTSYKVLAITADALRSAANDPVFACLKHLRSSNIPLALLEYVATKAELEPDDCENLFEDLLAFEVC